MKLIKNLVEGSFRSSSLDRSRNLRDKTCDSQSTCIYQHVHCVTLVAKGIFGKESRK